MEAADDYFMQRAIELAEKGGVEVAPNPKVGAVIVYNHQIIGEGYHRYFGGNHAEVEAVNSVKDKSVLPESTIYVTLEPCSHFGKTPPCCDLIIRNQFKRVVIGNKDPFKVVNGSGIQRLLDHGIEVTTGVLEQECRFMNRRFLIYQEKKRPYVILKWAESLDGFIDVERTNVERKIHRITGEKSHRLVHRWRSEEQGILVGWKTILNDDPQLNVRLVEGENPIRLILDAGLNAPEQSNVFDGKQKTIVFNKRKECLRQNLRYVRLKEFTFVELFNSLSELSIVSILVEGGRNTLQRFLDENQWDEVRRFRGNIRLVGGLEAPRIEQPIDTTLTIDDDQLDIYYNKILNG